MSVLNFEILTRIFLQIFYGMYLFQNVYVLIDYCSQISKKIAIDNTFLVLEVFFIKIFPKFMAFVICI